MFGGSPEGIIAAGIRCMGGVLQAGGTDDIERQKAIDAGGHLDRILTTADLVWGRTPTVTGVTASDMLRGVRYPRGGAHTDSIVMLSRSGTVRITEADHCLDRLRNYAAEFLGDDNAPGTVP